MTVMSPLTTIDLEFLQAPEQGDATSAAVPEARGHRGGVIVAHGVDLGRLDHERFAQMAVDDALRRKLAPYLGLTGSEARALLSAGPLRLSPAQVRQLDTAVHEPLIAELMERFERCGGIAWHALSVTAATVLVREALCQDTVLERSCPRLWRAAEAGDQAAMLRVLHDTGEVPAERVMQATEYLEQTMLDAESY